MGILDSLSKVRFLSKVPAEPKLLQSRVGPSTVERMGEEYEPKRVSPKDLETIYIREGMVHQWINTYSECVLASNYRIIAGNTREQRKIEDFLSTCNFRKLMRNSIRHQLTYGNAFWELVKNAGGSKVVTLAWLDPKIMDVTRDTQGKIIYGPDGKPKSYVQYTRWGFDLTKVPEDRRVQQMPKFDYQSGQGILMNRDEVVHFAFNEVGEAWWGVGIIEPIYNLILIKQNAEQGFAEAIQRTAYPRIWVQVGDEAHPPTQEEIDDVWKKLSELETKHQFVGPQYYKPIILEPKKTEKLALNLQYFIDQMVAGLGGPKPFVTGTGEKTNRATLGDQKLLLERRFKETQEELSEKVKAEVFARIAQQEKFKTIPRLEWDEVSTESLDSKAERLLKYTKAGLLLPDKSIRNLVRRIERLPEEEGDGGKQ